MNEWKRKKRRKRKTRGEEKIKRNEPYKERKKKERRERGAKKTNKHNFPLPHESSNAFINHSTGGQLWNAASG